MNIGKLSQRVRIDRKTTSQDATYGTPVVTWSELATVYAEVQDVLPSRAEKAGEGIQIASRPARIRMRYRSDITADMRCVLLDRANRVLQIVSGPAEIGRKEGIELMAQEYSSAGDAP